MVSNTRYQRHGNNDLEEEKKSLPDIKYTTEEHFQLLSTNQSEDAISETTATKLANRSPECKQYAEYLQSNALRLQFSVSSVSADDSTPSCSL